MKERPIKLVNIPRRPDDRQVYMQSFCEAWILAGGDFVGKRKLLANKLVKNLVKAIALTGVRQGVGRSAYLVCSRGGHLLKSSLPFNFMGEIVPMLWDCWPEAWPALERDLRLLKVRTCIMTASAAVERFRPLFPDITFIHLPEGVDMDDYRPGPPLVERSIDVYEIGRKYPDFHRMLIDGNLADCCNFIYLNKKADGRSFIFNDFDDFLEALRDAKITVSFPSSVTEPIHAQVETLSMRYWESMLSGCLIVGRCPRELSDILGYNPVIEADMNNPVGQLKNILANIGDYQGMADRNLAMALRCASWRVRIKALFSALECLGYKVN